MTTTLARILADTRDRLPELWRRELEIRNLAETRPSPPEWADGFGGSQLTVIAEVKRRSPSAGAIATGLDPAALACAYAAGGAGAISVLTNQTFFGGSLDDLEEVGTAVGLPLLRKDFIIDAVQVYEARAAGASAILLIVRALDCEQLADLARLASELGLATLVEVHTRDELDEALRIDPRWVGVNSRDLTTFRVEIDRLAGILRAVPERVTAIAESGIESRQDVELVASWGADAVLVGTALVRSPDPATAVKQLAGVLRRGRS
ncbi:MAG: indole-3-glycerol phosphate synthase TrpC [Gemmatimonadota bacterium]|nr:MAG: indole-3-glycerol phosphate synthase TrpC [Gemmatimonadota bacterium]